jgi:hypothetical protein
VTFLESYFIKHCTPKPRFTPVCFTRFYFNAQFTSPHLRPLVVDLRILSWFISIYLSILHGLIIFRYEIFIYAQFFKNTTMA